MQVARMTSLVRSLSVRPLVKVARLLLLIAIDALLSHMNACPAVKDMLWTKMGIV